MARLTAGTFLMHSTDGSAYTKLLDITAYPDMNQAPETIDVTTLSDWMHVYILGLEDSGGQLEFNTWLKASDMSAVAALTGEQYFSLWIGGTKAGDTITPTGSLLKRNFKGYISYVVNGAGTDEAAPASVVITNTTAYTDTIGSDSL